MERGANTFPFHNLLPYSESNKGLFLFFSPSLNWIKEKSVATLAIRTFAIQKSQSQFTVLHLATTISRLDTWSDSASEEIYNFYSPARGINGLQPCLPATIKYSPSGIYTQDPQ